MNTTDTQSPTTATSAKGKGKTPTPAQETPPAVTPTTIAAIVASLRPKLDPVAPSNKGQFDSLVQCLALAGFASEAACLKSRRDRVLTLAGGAKATTTSKRGDRSWSFTSTLRKAIWSLTVASDTDADRPDASARAAWLIGEAVEPLLRGTGKTDARLLE